MYTCSECGTKNESHYPYCKNCGAKRPAEDTEPDRFSAFTDGLAPEPQKQPDTEDGSPAPHSPIQQPVPPGQGDFYTQNIGGISSEELALFVGKKAVTILPKFLKMEITGSKVSWCWPVAILGYLFGPFGASLWFFYRKMYKAAFILLAIGAALTAGTTLMTYDSISESFRLILDELTSRGYSLFEFTRWLSDSLANQSSSLFNELSELGGALSISLANQMEQIANMATCIVCGLFGYHFYKEHAVKTIRRFREACTDRRYYKIALASIGGVSGGMPALGVVLWFLISSFLSFLTIFSVFSQL